MSLFLPVRRAIVSCAPSTSRAERRLRYLLAVTHFAFRRSDRIAAAAPRPWVSTWGTVATFRGIATLSNLPECVAEGALLGQGVAGTLRAMRPVWLVFVVVVYVSLDVANPLMPGAVTFGTENSLDMRQADRLRAHDSTALSPALPVSEVQGEARPTPMLGSWSPHTVATVSPPAPRARSSLLAPAAPSEDH
jgi:hypothetical protein